ncbi:MAG: hypothetical protein ACUVWA_15305 [Candidatus Oleimicrobiaceae bacterium]
MRTLELRRDPFEALDASADTHLHEYLVAHDVFESIWRDEISFLFAPAGGGKSAFRARVAGACRAGENGRRIFPIVYMLPESVVRARETEWPAAHHRGICWAAAVELFLLFAHRPREFISTDEQTQRMVRTLLQRDLKPSLEHLLDQLAPRPDMGPEARLRNVAQPYDPGAVWLNPPGEESLAEFRKAMERTPILDEVAWPDGDLAPWLDLLLRRMGFEAIYLLVDGVDAYPETIQDPEKAVARIKPLLDRASEWSQKRLFLKAFLPIETKSAIQRDFPLLASQRKPVIIQWTRELLIELLQRRVAVALNTERASLDMLAYPGFRGVDARVVDVVDPLPREVLAFASRMLLNMQQRKSGLQRLTQEDFEATLRWYKTDRRKEPHESSRE